MLQVVKTTPAASPFIYELLQQHHDLIFLSLTSAREFIFPTPWRMEAKFFMVLKEL